MTIETGIDLNFCVKGQKVKLRDGTIGIYYGLRYGDEIYPHNVYGWSYMSNGKYWEDERVSKFDVIEILPMESTSCIDLNTCVPGQKLERRDGICVEYVRKFKDSTSDYPHVAGGETYTHDGYYRRSKIEDEWDIVKILPLKSPMNIDLSTCAPGQKLELRNGNIVEYEYKLECVSPYRHKINGEDYTDDGLYLLDKKDLWDVVKILPLEDIEPAIDLRTCEQGQKVKLRNRNIVRYKKASGLIDYPHLLHNDKFYTDEGCYYRSKAVSPHDVMEILPMQCNPVTNLRACVPGQKIKLRCGEITTYKEANDSDKYPHRLHNGLIYTDEGYYWSDKERSDNDVMEILPLEEEPVKTEPEITHSITDQIDVTNPDHVSIIPHEHGVTISIKKGLTTISWRHYNH